MEVKKHAGVWAAHITLRVHYIIADKRILRQTIIQQKNNKQGLSGKLILPRTEETWTET